MKRVLAGLIVAVLVLSPLPTNAADAPGCEGLEQFRADLFPIGERWADELQAIGIHGADWDPLTLSSDDWRTYADISLEIHRDFLDVTAPEWAADWLQVRVDGTALQEQIGKAVADGGILLVLGFNDASEAIDQRDDEAKAAAIAHCADFEQFAYDWDALDGEVDGTPVATPAA